LKDIVGEKYIGFNIKMLPKPPRVSGPIDFDEEQP